MIRLALRLVLFWAVAEALYNVQLGQDTVVFWELDYAKEEYIAEVHTKRKKDEGGWIGIGFSNNGNVSDGSGDFCVAWKSSMISFRKEVPLTITDVHVLNGSNILDKDDQQDCYGFNYVHVGDTLKWTFRRKFVTCDIFDYALEEGTTHLHMIKGTGPLFDIKGVSIASASESTFKRIRFLKNIKSPPPVNQKVAWKFDVLNHKVKVEPVETTYWCQIMKLPDALKKKHHVIQPNIQKGNEELVHHMEVFHCETAVNVNIPLYAGPCDKGPPEIKVCSRVIGAWAMGADPLRYPSEAGFPIGGPEFNPYVRLEMHYNNPLLKSDWVDSSGMTFWVTDKLRKYDAGVIELGLEYIDKMAIPPKAINFPLTGVCNTECTSVGIPPDGITVFASQLHTHLTGTRVITRHLRPEFSSEKKKSVASYVELPPLNYDNHYSTHYQEIRMLKSPTKILPGDVLLTTCEFTTMDRKDATLGGFAISDEMCVNYIHYYPRASLEVCKSSVSWRSLREYFYFMKKMEGQSNVNPEGPVSDNYKNIKWTPFRAQLLSDFYNRSPIDMQCNQSDGNRFPGNWASMPVPKLPELTPRPNINQQCIELEFSRPGSNPEAN